MIIFYLSSCDVICGNSNTKIIKKLKNHCCILLYFVISFKSKRNERKEWENPTLLFVFNAKEFVKGDVNFKWVKEKK